MITPVEEILRASEDPSYGNCGSIRGSRTCQLEALGGKGYIRRLVHAGIRGRGLFRDIIRRGDEDLIELS